MKSRLLLLTGIAALAFVGPINVPAAAATITISDTLDTPTGITIASEGFFDSSQTTTQEGVLPGRADFHGDWIAPMPLKNGQIVGLNVNMNDPKEDGTVCCSDTLSLDPMSNPNKATCTST